MQHVRISIYIILYVQLPPVSVIDFMKFADCVALPGYPLDKIIILKQTPQDIVHRNTCLLYLMTFPGRYMANSM